MHEHVFQEHPEDGSRATVTESRAPLAEALAAVDKAMPDGYTDQGEARPHLSRALWRLSEAVRQHLIAFSEGDIATLAATAGELFDNADADALADLSVRQAEVVDKARRIYG
jgi:hypothetical protein